MLNGIFSPDAGKIEIAGKVGALIQLGAGFHPMLTGRENIYISGSVLGMSDAEVERKFRDIVDFSGISEFIDTPVKYYSSGMYARLGFSVAVHMEPDVLLVDEVLSVGDAEFRSKAMDRMWSLVSSGRSAVIFVSHNMVAVGGFCDRLILLEHGVAQTGSNSDLIARYLGDDVFLRYEKLSRDTREELLTQAQVFGLKASGEIEIRSVRLTNGNGEETSVFHPTDKLVVDIEYHSPHRLDNVVSSLSIVDTSGLVVSIERSVYHGAPPLTVEGLERLTIDIDPVQLKTGRYILGLAFQEPTMQTAYCLRSEDSFQVIEEMPNPGGKEGFFSPRIAWTICGRRHSRDTTGRGSGAR